MTLTRTVEVGGLTKQELRERLRECAVSLNRYAELLFDDERFTVSATERTLQTVELDVADLGFPEGATLPRIFARAAELGLSLCPLELGPRLRLQYLDQPEITEEGDVPQHQAPNGSITIASAPLVEDDEFPKGFYLRRIDGVLWLRGYRADDRHVWNPHDRFIFRR